MYPVIQITDGKSSFTAEIINLIVFYSTTLSIVVAQNIQCRMIKYTNT